MIFSIYLFLCANFAATIVAYYKQCYGSLSLCLITNIDEGIEIKLNRSSAARWCTDHSASLATITNVTVQSAIATFISDSNARFDRSTDVITNGYRFNLSGWEWTNGARSDLLPFGNGFRYACLVASRTGNPYVSICSHTYTKVKFICTYKLSNPSGSSCSNGYLRTGTICYKIQQKEAAWFAARNLCLREVGSDLAVFDHGVPSITSNESTYYWIGLRTEKWTWWNGYGHDEVVKYSNWDGWSPSSSSGDCLCVRTRTGEWTQCDCSRDYRYICIQDYATGSASTFKPPTTKMTTRMTKTTAAMTKLKTTHSTTTFIHSVGNSSSSSRYLSAPTQTLDNDSKSNVSDDPLNTHGSEITSGNGILVVLIPIVVLIVLVAVIAVVSCIVITKLRKRSTTQAVLYVNSAVQPTSSIDDHYTTLKRECLTGNETYAALNVNVYETVGDGIYKNSK